MRYSTDSQELKVQKEEIEKYIISNIKTEAIETTKDYIDAGFSGKDLNRIKFEEMKNDILANKIDTVIALKLDRLSRSLADLITIFKFFSEQNVAVMLVKEKVDTTTSQGKLMFQIMGAFAEFERDSIRERFKDGKEYAKLHGTKSGKPQHRPRVEFNLKEAKKLRELGLSYNKIAKSLGIKSGITVKNRLDGK